MTRDIAKNKERNRWLFEINNRKKKKSPPFLREDSFYVLGSLCAMTDNHAQERRLVEWLIYPRKLKVYICPVTGLFLPVLTLPLPSCASSV